MTFAGPIDNRIEITTAQYAAILGATPSKGARSPLLWNAAFKVAGIDAMMYPMDTTPDHLGAVVAALKADPRFVGGAVAVPHKQAVGAFLDRLEPEAARIGAVNAIYRDGDALVGANTDGAGALSQIEILVGGADVLKTKRATLIGLGGAGLAVAAYLAGRTASLTVANRTRATADAASQKLGAVAVDYPLSPEVLEATDLLVNATTVGHPDGPEGSAGAGEPAGGTAGRCGRLRCDLPAEPDPAAGGGPGAGPRHRRRAGHEPGPGGDRLRQGPARRAAGRADPRGDAGSVIGRAEMKRILLNADAPDLSLETVDETTG